MAKKRIMIGEYLIKKGVVTEAQLDKALEESKRTRLKIGEVLVKRGYATEEDVARALSEQLGFAYMDLSSYDIEPAALSLVPREAASRLQAVPLFLIQNSLTVAMANPLDISAIDELGRLSGGLRIEPVLGTPGGIKKAIERQYKKARPDSPSPAQPRQPAAGPEKKEMPEALIKEATQASVIRIVSSLIEEAVSAGASDIHLEPQKESLSVRFRIDGVLQEAEAPTKSLQNAVISRIKIMADMDIAQSRLPQDGRAEMKALNRAVDLRIATFPTIYGEHLSIRILDKSGGIMALEKLGFREYDMERLNDIIHKPYGFMLVTGPTGSGKTTTLYAVLNRINDLKKNIITLEDPIEYTISRVNQSQVNVKAGLTFASGLRSIVRLDPDVIMIGEIRDDETADMAIRSSLTGHLVFSTLHTNNASSCATRLVDIGVEPYLVASSLIGALAQRLVRKLCPECKKEYRPGREELSIIEKITGKGPRKQPFYTAAGCKECRNIGYRGRTSIFELLVTDNEIRELIVRKAPAYEIEKAARGKGMKTLREDGLKKVEDGITSLSEVLRVTEET